MTANLNAKILDTLLAHVSVRAFRDKPRPEGVVEKAVETGKWFCIMVTSSWQSPSGENGLGADDKLASSGNLSTNTEFISPMVEPVNDALDAQLLESWLLSSGFIRSRETPDSPPQSDV